MKRSFLAVVFAPAFMLAPALAAAPKAKPSAFRLFISTSEPVIARGRLGEAQVVKAYWIEPRLVQRSRNHKKVAAALDAKLRRIAKTISVRTPRNALFSNEKGHWVARQRTGWKVDLKETGEKLLADILGGNSESRIVLKTSEPARSVRDLAKQGVLFHYSGGTSSFAGSPVFREKNIEVGALKLHGRYVKAGQEFSFNQYVGWVDDSTGFVPGFIIEGDTLSKEDGGGICQVSATIFRAVFAGGLPITERHQHSHRVRYYDPVGFEATVYAPYKDFRFQNDTGTTLFVQAKVDRARKTLRFDLFGAQRKRKVTVSQPVATAFKPPAEPTYVAYPGVAAGTRRLLDRPEQGMTVVVRRTVASGGRISRDDVKSVYAPWGAVYGVKPGDSRARAEAAR